MGMDELNIENRQKDKKENGIYCSSTQIFFAVVISAGIVLAIGLLAFYLPDRTCTGTRGVAESITRTEPNNTEQTELQNTEPTDKLEIKNGMVTPTAEPWNGRLPYRVVPLRYDLTLTPYLYDDDVGDGQPGDRRFTFDGEVNIRVTCMEVTNIITMHINNITIHRLHVYSMNDKSKNLMSSYSIDEEYQFLNVKLTTEMKKNEDYEVMIMYLGELSDGLSGFYRSTYVNEDGEEKWLATTQMQPTDARRALPCFDEPDFKAVFDTTIRHRDDMTAVSNGIEMMTTDWETYPGWKETVFKRTPKMPTYLLAFVVSDFVYSEQTTTNNVLFRVWSRPGAVDNQAYALDQGVRMTTYFEEFFDYGFPLEKQDMMAIPDFAIGAMENWGLILYRESALLYDPKVNSASNKQWVSIIVSHELAHQWFGNLVTPIWWDDLWLNEGFACFVEYLGVNYTEPSWEMEPQFLVLDLHYVFTLDALGSSHPIRVPVNSPDEINEIFDSISYSKGASILRMLNYILTEEVFLRGLADYLKLHSFGNTDSNDLWASLTYADREHGGRDVKKIMDTWTLQMGYPVLTFGRLDDKRVNVSQKHFLINPDSPVEDKYGDLGYVWEVEVTHTHASEMEYENPTRSFLERTKSEVVNLADGVQPEDWYLANIKQYGYFRINYDETNWNRLTTQLNTDHLVLPVENRAQLIDDAFNLARAGEISQVTALNLTAYLDQELEYLPWEATLTVMEYTRNMFSRYPGYGHLQRYMLEKIMPLYKRLGWNDDQVNDPHLEQYNRINAIKTTCFYGLEDCRNQAVALYSEYMKNHTMYNPITPNLKSIVYCNGIREGGQEEWEFGLARYQETIDSSEKRKWLKSLSCTQEPWILSRYLEQAFDPDVVRKQDAVNVIGYVADNYVGRALAWDFTRANWERIREDFGGGLFAFSDLISDITEHFNTEFDLEQLIDFGEGKDFGSGTRTYEQQVEKTKANIRWMDENAEETAQWFEDQLNILMSKKQ